MIRYMYCQNVSPITVRSIALQTALSGLSRIVFCNCRDSDVGFIDEFRINNGTVSDPSRPVGICYELKRLRSDNNRPFQIIEDTNPTFSLYVSYRCLISNGSNNRQCVNPALLKRYLITFYCPVVCYICHWTTILILRLSLVFISYLKYLVCICITVL